MSDVGLLRIVTHRCVDLTALQNVPKERISWASALDGLPKVWSKSRGHGTRIAVLDTGVDPDHIDLKDAIDDTEDFTQEGVEDLNGHGTHCAGIIAARLNSVGLVGVAPDARLLIAKVLDNNGGGPSLTEVASRIASGIDWAVKNDADIISLSLGLPASDMKLFVAVHRALSEGITVVCSAGNEGSIFTNGIGYPGRYGSVITVAAHDPNGNPAGFSSRGGEIDLMAPGTHIWSTYKNSSYAELSGTSMSAPFVAGICALILGKHKQSGPHQTPIENSEDMREHLLWMTAHPGHHDNAQGYGPLQPFAAFGANM